MHRPKLPAVVVLLAAVGALDKVTGQLCTDALGEYAACVTGFVNSVLFFVVYHAVLGIRMWTGVVDIDQLRYMYGSGAGGACHPGRPSQGRVSSCCCERMGVWTRAMRCCEHVGAWKYVAVAGLGDSVSEVLGLLTRPYMTSVSHMLVSQLNAPLLAFWSMALLKERYTVQEVLGYCLMLSGVVLACVDGSNPSFAQRWNSVGHMLLLAASSVPSALAWTLKQKVFHDYRKNEVSLLFPNNGFPRAASIHGHERRRFASSSASSSSSGAACPPPPGRSSSAGSGSVEVALVTQVRLSGSVPPATAGSSTAATSALPRAASYSGSTSGGDNRMSVLSTDLFRALGRTDPSIVFGEPKDLDLWCVSSCAGLFQLLWSPIVIGVLISAQCSRKNRDVGEFVGSAMACLAGHEPHWDIMPRIWQEATCEAAAAKLAVYSLNTLLFNVLVYMVIRRYTALLAFVSTKLSLPLGFMLLALPIWRTFSMAPVWPTGDQILSLVVILVGLFVFRHGTEVKERRPIRTGCCWPLCGSAF